MEEILKSEIDHRFLMDEVEDRLMDIRRSTEGIDKMNKPNYTLFSRLLEIKILLIRDAVQKGISL